MKLANTETVAATGERSYDEQYHWLLERIDPASSLERQFVDYLYGKRLRLPERAQFRPAEDVPAQPDFYFERAGIPGVCIFVDGPHHDNAQQADRDEDMRDALRDRGYRVVVIRYDRPFEEQIAPYPGVFGSN